jgi:hypothetical protein
VEEFMRALVPVLLLAIPCLTACGGHEEPPTDGTTPADPSPTASTAATAATGDTGQTGATGDTATDTAAPYVGPVLIDLVALSCDADDVFEFYLETVGLTHDGVVYAQETGNYPPAQWSENFTLESFEYDADGAWDHLRHTLETQASLGSWTPNVNTLFSCGAHFDPVNEVMSYAVAVYDESDVFADCIAWGENPQGMIDGTAGNNVNLPLWNLAPCVVGVPPY